MARFCSTCKKEKPVSKFYKDYRKPGHFQKTCKKCICRARRIGKMLKWYEDRRTKAEPKKGSDLGAE